MNSIEKLEPTDVWKYFAEICKVPRPSKKEGKIIEYLLNFGKSHNLDTQRDEVGNVLIKKPATKGFENCKTIVLQSHIDMVCEKNTNSTHNFETDAIQPIIDGEWVCANGTTLGADDGMGIAAQLAVLASQNIEHPAIECLFTVDEETGLTGAFALKDNFLTGKTLINLDSEDEGEIFIGCAGGIDTTATIKYKTQTTPDNSSAYKISISGLHGGHSGDDINKGFANANKIITKLLWSASHQFNIGVAKIEGGNLRNAIPRDCYAIVTVDANTEANLLAFIDEYKQQVISQFSKTELTMNLQVEKDETPTTILATENRDKLLNSLMACPNGVIAMSQSIDNLVETSTNLASIKFIENDKIVIATSQRSSVEDSKYNIALVVANAFKSNGAEITHSEGYPGWNPNPNSQLLALATNCYKQRFGKEPKVKALHAGLECGLFLEKYPEMDMISVGPTLRNVHSPSEKVEIATVAMFYNFLLDILKNAQNL